jgi:prepilin-type N-terminal cleavage/methylation domain-containing protein
MSKSQRGFTLVEVLISIAIVGVMGGGITTVIYQIFDVNAMSTNRMTAIKEVEYAIHWITPDAQMAQSLNSTAPSGFPLTLTWVEWNNTSNNVTYSVQNGQLQRSQSVNGGQPIDTILMRHLNPDPQMTNCQFSSGVLTFKITATVTGFRSVSETRSLNIISRSTP